MKRVFVIVCFFSVIDSFAQLEGGPAFKASYNRVGVGFDLCWVMRSNVPNGVFGSLGVKTYGHNYVFTKQVVGPTVGMAYFFEKSHWQFGPAVHGAMFREKKNGVKIGLIEYFIDFEVGYEFSSKLRLSSSLGLGWISTNSYLINWDVESDFSYPNYEISLGISYSFGGID